MNISKDYLKRIRLVSILAGAVLFGSTAVTQFKGQATEFVVMGVIISAALGVGTLWILLTVVMFFLGAYRKK